MPLVAHHPLPTLNDIQKEGQEILTPERALSQDIRELHIGLLNMMPDGALKATERQFLRLIGNCNRIAQFYVHPFTLEDIPRNSATQDYIQQYYEPFEQIAEQGLDALIVTGTNPTQAKISDEPFLPAMQNILKWADSNVSSVLYSCLASHAAFEYFYNIQRQPLKNKLFGVYPHRILDPSHPLLSNINTRFDMPHSRKNDIDQTTLQAHNIPILIASEQAGVALATSKDGFRHIYLQGHPEYDQISLLKEYQRDLSAYFEQQQPLPNPPNHYFTEKGQQILDDFLNDVSNDMRDFPYQQLSQEIDITWRDTAKAIFANWLGLVYQLTHSNRKQQYMQGIDPNNPLKTWRTP